MSEALLDKKIEYWQNQLLDLGKRNKMINYRETKRATLKLVEPEFEELFNRIAVNEEELTFQSPVDKNSDIRTYSVLSLLETLSCPIPVNIGDIKADGSILERQKTLKHPLRPARRGADVAGVREDSGRRRPAALLARPVLTLGRTVCFPISCTAS